MDPISAINGLVATVRGAYSALKAVNSVKAELSNMDVQMKLLDAQKELVGAEEQLLDIRRQVLALTEENEGLKAEITKLKSNVPEVVPRDGLYYSAADPTDGPFCTACYDDAGKLIRVQSFRGTGRIAARYQIQVCSVQSPLLVNRRRVAAALTDLKSLSLSQVTLSLCRS